MSGALAARGADREAERGRVERTKVHRYWAGKAPEWAYDQVNKVTKYILLHSMPHCTHLLLADLAVAAFPPLQTPSAWLQPL